MKLNTLSHILKLPYHFVDIGVVPFRSLAKVRRIEVIGIVIFCAF